MQWLRDMAKGVRDNAAYDALRLMILGILAAIWPAINGYLTVFWNKPWYWKLNGVLIGAAALLFAVSAVLLIRLPASASRPALLAGAGKRFWTDYFGPGPKRSMILVIALGAIVGGALAGLVWTIAKSDVAAPANTAVAPQRQESHDAAKPAQGAQDADWIAFPRPPAPPPPFVPGEQLFTKPTFPDGTTAISVRVMGNPTPIQFALEELKSRSIPVPTDNPNMPIARIYLAAGTLCIDATTVGGIRIRGNHFETLPAGWDFNGNDRAAEIVNEKRVAVYQIRLAQKTVVEFGGIVLCDGGKMFASVGAHGRPIIFPIGKLNEDLPTMPYATTGTKRIFKYPSYKFRGVFEDEEPPKPPSPTPSMGASPP